MSFHCVFLPGSTSGSCAGILADTLHQSDNLFTSRRAGLVGGGWGENKRFMDKRFTQGTDCRPLLFHKMSLEANKYNLECVTIGFGKGISLFCISCMRICGIFVKIF